MVMLVTGTVYEIQTLIQTFSLQKLLSSKVSRTLYIMNRVDKLHHLQQSLQQLHTVRETIEVITLTWPQQNRSSNTLQYQ